MQETADSIDFLNGTENVCHVAVDCQNLLRLPRGMSERQNLNMSASDR